MVIEDNIIFDNKLIIQLQLIMLQGKKDNTHIHTHLLGSNPIYAKKYRQVNECSELIFHPGNLNSLMVPGFEGLPGLHLWEHSTLIAYTKWGFV